jgi:hypothetical protein
VTAVAISSFILGAVFLLTGLYAYRGPNLERLRRYSYFSYVPGAFFSLFPLGLGFVLFSLFLWIPSAALSITCFWLAVVLVIVGVVLWVWSPSWTKPYWMRDDIGS